MVADILLFLSAGLNMFFMGGLGMIYRRNVKGRRRQENEEALAAVAKLKEIEGRDKELEAKAKKYAEEGTPENMWITQWFTYAPPRPAEHPTNSSSRVQASGCTCTWVISRSGLMIGYDYMYEIVRPDRDCPARKALDDWIKEWKNPAYGIVPSAD